MERAAPSRRLDAAAAPGLCLGRVWAAPGSSPFKTWGKNQTFHGQAVTGHHLSLPFLDQAAVNAKDFHATSYSSCPISRPHLHKTDGGGLYQLVPTWVASSLAAFKITVRGPAKALEPAVYPFLDTTFLLGRCPVSLYNNYNKKLY